MLLFLVMGYTLRTETSRITASLMGAGIIATMIRTIAASPILATYPLTTIVGG